MNSQLKDQFFSDVFAHVPTPTECLTPLWTHVDKRMYAPNEFLLHHGDRWSHLFYIQSGIIRLFYTDLEGREFNKAFFWEGHCIWPVAPRDRNENSLFSVAALAECTILACPFTALYAHLTKLGCWAHFALPYAELLVEQKFVREHDLLLLSATERYAKFRQTHAAILGRIADYQLASYLGITNVSLSRIKRAMPD
ncbi:MAG: Crp/Fnr family transcriptional regulator [Caldilineaceae bacterium]|nr:Crp/Fnr family transcriptional regulator [Caldilineaceae bacterium]